MKDLSSFEIIGFTDQRLLEALNNVLDRIPEEYADSFPCIDIVQQKSFLKEGAFWCFDLNTITLDPNVLSSYSDDILYAIIAHELAHAFHHHGKDSLDLNLDNEYEADSTAINWGFKTEIQKLRDVITFSIE